MIEDCFFSKLLTETYFLGALSIARISIQGFSLHVNSIVSFSTYETVDHTEGIRFEIPLARKMRCNVDRLVILPRQMWFVSNARAC